MLEIEYKGGNSVVFATKNSRLAIDPNVSLLGLKNPKKLDVQLGTERRFLLPESDDYVTLEGPGEYEAGLFSIRGEAAQRNIDTEADLKQSTIYHIDVLGYRIGVLGNVSAKLTDDQFEELGVVDILVVPVGGSGYTIDATDATKLVRQIEPKVVIPVHFKEDGINYEVPQESLDVFAKELNVTIEEVEKVKFKTPAALPVALTVYRLSRT